MKTIIIIETIFNKIKLKFKPSKSIVFVSFNKNYYKLTLINYNNVINYIKKLRKAKNKFFKCDLLYKIREHYFVYIFFSSFDSRFEIFLIIFNQIYNLISSNTKNKITAIFIIIFDKAVIATKKKK